MAIPFPEIDPNAFVIPGLGLPIRWYALAYIGGLIVGWQIVMRLMRRPALWGGIVPMQPKQVEDLLTWVVMGVVLGGRLGFVLFYEPGYYLTHPLEILKVWQGGMAFHGGFLGTVVAITLFCRKYSLPMLSVGDAAALVAPIGLFLGRVANFIKPELWGRPTDASWGVIFPVDAAQYCQGIAGQVDGLCARHPSQLYEAGLEGLLLGAILWGLVLGGRALRRPGTVFGVFLIGYGLARGFVELFRQPDAQFQGPGNPLGLALQFGEYGLTMGQILSIPMVLVGLFFVVRARRG